MARMRLAPIRLQPEDGEADDVPVEGEAPATSGPVAPPPPRPSDEPSVDRVQVDPLPGERFETVLMVEGMWTGDGRYFHEGGTRFRDMERIGPLPFMADDTTHEAHLEARLVGNIDTVWRDSGLIRGEGSYIETDDERTSYLQGLLRTGRLRGVSADLDDPEFDIVLPAGMMAEPTIDEDGTMRLSGEMPRFEFRASRLMGATAVPFPALQYAGMVQSEAMVAAAVGEMTGQITGVVLAAGSLTAAAPISPPVEPPSEWLRNPQLTELTPFTIEDSGRLLGHLAGFGSCHIGFADQCVTAPRSATAYAHYLTGELRCSDGTRVPVGQITMDTGHAPLDYSANRAIAHYDHTGLAVADITVGEDRYGVWLAGALRPGVEPAQVRALMAADLSGDWRRIGGSMELVGVLAVNVPGFHKPRVSVAMRDSQVASLVASLGITTAMRPDRSRVQFSDRLAQRMIDAMLEPMGRSTRQRVAAQVARIKGAR